jgi:HK97 gp10 family phage protein
MPQIVAGMYKLTQQLNQLGVEFTTDDLVEGALVIAVAAEDNCPVDTGFLRSTVFVKEEGDDVLIGFDAPYASYVEFGTYKMEAQPYLRPALDEAGDAALSAILDSVLSHLRGIAR